MIFYTGHKGRPSGSRRKSTLFSFSSPFLGVHSEDTSISSHRRSGRIPCHTHCHISYKDVLSPSVPISSDPSDKETGNGFEVYDIQRIPDHIFGFPRRSSESSTFSWPQWTGFQPSHREHDQSASGCRKKSFRSLDMGSVGHPALSFSRQRRLLLLRSGLSDVPRSQLTLLGTAALRPGSPQIRR